jgi:lysylphosphatidylglycerol synthetase-like protein (DUF2156 family)
VSRSLRAILSLVITLAAFVALERMFGTLRWRELVADFTAVGPWTVSSTWLVSVVSLLVALTWVGLFAHRHVEDRDALWWQFAWHGEAWRFLRASLVSSVLLAALALHSVITRRPVRHPPQHVPDIVGRLVAESDSSEDNVLLLGDKAFLMEEGRAALGFGDTGRSLVACGDPIGDAEAGKARLWRLRELADREGKAPVFFTVTERFLTTFLDMGPTVKKLGETARTDRGAAPLAGMDMHPLSSRWNKIFGLTYRHGARMYRFEGLRDYKQKFDPVWSSRFNSTAGGLSMPRAFLDANLLISGGVSGQLVEG